MTRWGELVAASTEVGSEPPDVAAARQIVNDYDCAIYGHYWDVIVAADHHPVRILCRRCGKSYKVADE